MADGPSEAEAERVLTEILRQLDTGSLVDPGKLTVARYDLEMWLPHQATRVRPGPCGGTSNCSPFT